jgi:hypothetical protein
MGLTISGAGGLPRRWLRRGRLGVRGAGSCFLRVGLSIDHRDDRSGYLGASHRACNRATAGRLRTREIPPDDPERHVFYGPDGERWSRLWEEWR